MAGLLRLNPLARSLLQPTSRLLLSSSASHSLSYSEALLNVPETKVTALKNGVRVATEDTNGDTATVGVYIEAGSRHETSSNGGVSHFLEHALLKGTAKRAQSALEAEIEGLGGELSSFSSRERTAFFAKVAKKDATKAVEILGDIIQNPSFKAESIEAVRKEILEKIENTEENVQHSIFDHLHSTAFQGGNLAHTIYGPAESVKAISQEHLKAFLTENYTGPRIVLAGAGVNHDELVKAAEQSFGGLSSSNNKKSSKTPRFVGSEIRIRDDEKEDAHIVFAVEGPNVNSPDLFPILVVQYLLNSWDRSLGGGKNLSSRLAGSIANYNLCSGYRAFTSTYSDTGLFGFYVTTELHERLGDLFFQFQNDWVRICVNAGEAEVQNAKNQLKAATLFGLNGTTPISHDIGHQVLSYGRRLSAYEVESRINAINASTIRSIAYKYLYDKDPAIVAYGPIEAFPDYNRIQTATHWLRV